MRLAVAGFSSPGATVLDPFAGWGTTLVAAALEGRRGVGLEIEPERAKAAHRRLLPYRELTPQLVLRADARRPVLARGSVDLALTSVPYFGIGRWDSWGQPAAAGQLYAAPSYAEYLAMLDEVFRALRPQVRVEGYVIVMAQNVRLEGVGFVPLAWDAARLLARHFSLLEERIICYRRPADGADLDVTNRAHEYMLVAKA